ncbi:MAG: cell division protein ZapA, partial [Bacillota bacterium]
MGAGDNYNSNKYTIKILGEKLTVTGDISREYIEELAEYVNQISREITRAYPRLPRRRLMKLTLINLVDELFKLKDSHQEKVRENQRLKKENQSLRSEINSLKEDYEELSL